VRPDFHDDIAVVASDDVCYASVCALVAPLVQEANERDTDVDSVLFHSLTNSLVRLPEQVFGTHGIP
jgi:hypothetical protein